MKPYTVLFVDTGLRLEPKVYQVKPIGGSELSLLLLAEGLCALGHRTIILQPEQRYYCNDQFIIDDLRKLTEYIPTADLLVLNRAHIDLTLIPTTLPIFYFSHDAYDQQILDWLSFPNVISRLTKIICVSEWQAYTFRLYRNIPAEKLTVVPNACFKAEWCWGHERSQKNNILTYASIPFKGLHMLPDLFFDICMNTKRDDLELWIFSSYKLYDREDDAKTHAVLSQLRRMKGVKLFPLLPPSELINMFKKAHVYVHPQTYHETFGMVIAQAMATGMIPVSTSKGALPELISHNENGLLTTGPNIEEYDTWAEFVDLVATALEPSSYKLSLKAQRVVEKFDYVRVANQFLTTIGGYI